MSYPVALTARRLDEITGGRLRNGQLPSYTEWGAYPIIYITRSCEILCAVCATEETDYPLWWPPDDPIVAADVYYEGPDERCANCNTVIESAYGDPGN